MTHKTLAITFLALILTTANAPAATEDIHAGSVTRIDRRQFAAEAQQNSFPTPTLPADTRLDPYSVECLTCHDGGIASATHFTTATGSRTLNSHPVGVPYPSRPDFAPIHGTNIVLIDGRVSCVTCHDLDKGGYRLAIDNTNSRLCFTCHLK